MTDPKNEAKDPIPLRDPAGEVVLVMCGGCRMASWSVRMFGGAGPGALDECYRVAREHCERKPCDRCGAPRDTTCYVICRDCRAAKERENLHAAFANAKKVPLAEYDGEMVTDGDEDGFEFILDFDANTDHALELDDGTRFVWGTRPEGASIDLEDECRESWLQEHHEDAFDAVDLDKLAEAQVLVDQALARVKTYYEDRSIAVVLPPREAASADAQGDDFGGES